MQIYNNLEKDNYQFVTKTTATNKDGIYLLITKSKLVSKKDFWELNYYRRCPKIKVTI